MAVTKFSGVLDLDIHIKAEMKQFKNDEGNMVDYVSYFIEVPGIGGEVQKFNVIFRDEQKMLAKYLIESLINKALDKNSAANSYIGF